ncbi:MAG: DNA polymerase III subunit delta' [Alphaproteobacteria bacterium]
MPEVQPIIYSPRTQNVLFGHQKIEKKLLQSWQQNRLHHGLLLTGPKGVGKATFAFRLAKFLLSNPDVATALDMSVEPDHPIGRRVASGGHGDLLVVEPKEESATQEISVDQVRDVTQFLRMKPMEGGWRVAIIDGAMNRNAANALLKGLEEPPKRTMMIVVSNAVGTLPSTIKSRCQVHTFQALSSADVKSIIAPLVEDLSDKAIEQLITLSQGSPGRAMQLYELDGLGIHQDLVKTVKELQTFSLGPIAKFSETYTARIQKEGIAVFNLLGDYFLNLIDGAIRTPQESLLPERSAEQWAMIWHDIDKRFTEAKRFHLNRYEVLMHSLQDITGV